MEYERPRAQFVNRREIHLRQFDLLGGNAIEEVKGLGGIGRAIQKQDAAGMAGTIPAGQDGHACDKDGNEQME